MKIGNYYPGRPNPNTPSVTIGGVTVFFSYRLPIAFSMGGRLYCNETFYSGTSQKHLMILKRGHPKKSFFRLESDFLSAMDSALYGTMKNIVERTENE